MMPGGRQVRLDVNEPDHMEYILRSGLAWQAGPEVYELALEALREGVLDPAECENLPPEVAAEFGVEPELEDEEIPSPPVEPAVPLEEPVPLDAEQPPVMEQEVPL